jgi:hypothetical protein
MDESTNAERVGRAAQAFMDQVSAAEEQVEEVMVLAEVSRPTDEGEREGAVTFYCTSLRPTVQEGMLRMALMSAHYDEEQV